MMTNTAGPLLAIAALLTAAAAPAESVFVRGREAGQGMTVSNGSTCYVLTPLHVLKEMTGPGEYSESEDDQFTVIDGNGISASARIRQEYRDADLALGEIGKPGQLQCGRDWSDGAALQRTLKLKSAVTVTTTGERRSVSAMDGTVRELRGDREFVIQTARPTDQFRKGMSGSIVEQNGQMAGMLMSVDTARQMGNVLRQDHIHALAGSAVTPPRVQNITIGVLPFTAQRQVSPQGNAGLARAFAGQQKVSRVPLTRIGTFPGHALAGELLSTNCRSVRNPAYVRPATAARSNNLLGNILESALRSAVIGGAEKGGNSSSPSLYTCAFEISWKLVQANGVSIFEEIDRPSFSIGTENYQRGVTDSEMLEEAVAKSAAAILERF